MNIPILIISLVVSFVICIPFIVKSRNQINGKSFYENAKINNRVVTATLTKSRRSIGDQSESYRDLKFGQEYATYSYSLNGKTYKKSLVFQNSPPHTLDLFYVEGNPKKAYSLGEAGGGKTVPFPYKLMRILPFILTAVLYLIIEKVIL